MNNKIRNRVYKYYVSAGSLKSSVSTINCLAPRASILNKLIARHFPADKCAEIIDLGCGHGAIIHFAQLAGYVNIWGVDGSAEQVSVAQNLGINNVVERDLFEFLSELKSESKDCIVSFDVIEHLTREELVEMVDAVYRVLKPGGRWIIHIPNGGAPFAGRVRYGDLTHEIAFTPTSINQLCYSSGFGEVNCFEDEPVPHGIKSGIRLGLWKCIRYLLRFYLAVETGDASRDAIFSQNFLAVATK